MEESTPTVVEILHQRLMAIVTLVIANTSVQPLYSGTNIIPSCFQFTIFPCTHELLCVFLLDLLTGAVGLPLPSVEVQIVMNNKTNITIVEGSHRETRVNTELISYKPIFRGGNFRF